MPNRHFQRRYQSIEMVPMDDCNSDNNSNHTWLPDGVSSMQLKRSEMNALIMDYLVHEGFKEAAERFREEAKIEPTNLIFADDSNAKNSSSHQLDANCDNNNGDEVNAKSNSFDGADASITIMNGNGKDHQRKDWFDKIETPEMMDKRIEIRQLIEKGDILRAQTLINLYYPELLDNHRQLYFRLQQQHLIELIRQQKINEVLSYVHDQLSVDELRDLTEMERTLALLAYENPDKSPYSNLLHTSHRLQLASEMNNIILKETTGNVESTNPRLVTLLKLLVWTQSELEKKNSIKFPKMTDLVNGTIIEMKTPPKQ